MTLKPLRQVLRQIAGILASSKILTFITKTWGSLEQFLQDGERIESRSHPSDQQTTKDG